MRPVRDLTPTQIAWMCHDCGANGRRGYCAPNVCLCGHETCHAFASFIQRRNPLANVTELPTQTLWKTTGGFGNPEDNCGTTKFATRKAT